MWPLQQAHGVCLIFICSVVYELKLNLFSVQCFTFFCWLHVCFSMCKLCTVQFLSPSFQLCTLVQVGGNGKAKTFFMSQSDYRPGMDFKEKYNSRAAALYRDKVSCCLSEGSCLWPYVHCVHCSTVGEEAVCSRYDKVCAIFFAQNCKPEWFRLDTMDTLDKDVTAWDIFQIYRAVLIAAPHAQGVCHL